MNVIYVNLFRGYGDKVSSPITLDEVANLIRENPDVADMTGKYRHYLSIGDGPTADRIKKQSLCFAVAVRFQGGKRREDICGWTGLSMVDFDHLQPAQLPELLQRIRADRHTLMAYTTISGKGIRVIFRIEGLGDNLMKNLKLYEAAFLRGNQYYAKLTGCDFDKLCKNPTRLCGVAHDTMLFYQPDAEPFRVSPEEIATDRRAEKRQPSRDNFLKRAVKAAERTLAEREVCYEPGQRNAYIMQMGYLLNGYGIEQTAATDWAADRFADYDGDVASIFASCYRQTEEHGRLPLYPRKGDASKEREGFFASVEEIEEFLHTQVRLRQNVITGRTEFYLIENGKWEMESSTGKNDVTDWAELDDRTVNSLWCRMSKQVKAVRINDLRNVLHSEHAELFNPFLTYFRSLPAWDGVTDYIGELADTVHVKDGEQALFRTYFRKWLVAAVTSWLEPEVVNHEILVLIGPQGCYKTTWLSRLLPPPLQRYFYIKSNNNRITKDDMFSLAEFAFICMEEIDGLEPKEVNQIKAITTMPAVNERMAYAHYKEHRPHFASFCGTTNHVQFLTDFTSNRRWLPFEVERIESPYEHIPNYAGVYAQALALRKQGFCYWLTDEEIQAVNARNFRFEVPCMEMEQIESFFRRPLPGEERAIFATNSYILNRINQYSRLVLSPVKVGQAMKKAGYEPIRFQGKRGYRVVELTAEEVMANKRAMARFL